MAKLIEASDISTAWVKAMDYLLAQGGKASNLFVCVAPEGVGKESLIVRTTFDEFLKAHESKRVRSIKKVSDTIFPQDFYRGGPGKEAREHLYRMQGLASCVERRYIRCGTYFDRLINWPVDENARTYANRNQLERIIKLLQTSHSKGRKNGNKYELAISNPDIESEITVDTDEYCDLRVQNPLLDTRPLGFPCLSHISLTLFDGRIDLTAQYRNQHFITKAYGNFLGLSCLLRFIALEAGYNVGELVCVATHADAEKGEGGIRVGEIKRLVDTCRFGLE